jgi:hypothetical protein
MIRLELLAIISASDSEAMMTGFMAKYRRFMTKYHLSWPFWAGIIAGIVGAIGVIIWAACCANAATDCENYAWKRYSHCMADAYDKADKDPHGTERLDREKQVRARHILQRGLRVSEAPLGDVCSHVRDW